MLETILNLLIAKRLRPIVFERADSITLSYRSQEIGLYVHIPFCRRLCPFCPYYKVLYDYKLVERFKSALVTEIEIIGNKYKNKKIDSVYFGGGTPALLIEYLPEIKVKNLI